MKKIYIIFTWKITKNWAVKKIQEDWWYILPWDTALMECYWNILKRDSTWMICTTSISEKELIKDWYKQIKYPWFLFATLIHIKKIFFIDKYEIKIIKK